MKQHLTLRLCALVSLLVPLLSACGGGEDSDSGTPRTPLAYPNSGGFGWTLKASGPTNALKHGLSLVHPSLPDNEYVVEGATQAITDTRLVVSGTVSASQLTATAIQPHALVYIYDGDVRSVPMQANGTQPSTRVKRSNTSSACRFILTANDHASPDSSRFIVSTAGTDGRCGTSDDGRAEVRLTSTGSSLGYTILADEFPLELARDPLSLAPRGWIYPNHIELWGATPPSAISLRSTGQPAISRVVASTYQSALVEDGTRLSVLNFGSANSATEVPLNTTLTRGDGWQLIGFDASAFYVYFNRLNPDAFSSPWKVLKITRGTPAATELASGTGIVSIASMGSGVLYLTVFKASNNHLVRINKSTGAADERTYPITTKPSVQTGASGKHQLWFVTQVGSAAVNHAVEIIDESGTTLYASPNSTPLSVAEAGIENFNASESRTRFIFAQGFGTRAFSNASLVSYDTSTSTASVLGTLPGPAEFGNDFVFASAAGGPGSFGVGFATRSSAGAYADQGARVFSFDLGSPNSMKTTQYR